jgi:CDGSH-type Zn-finger protein
MTILVIQLRSVIKKSSEEVQNIRMNNNLGAVAHTYNTPYLGGRDTRIIFQASPGKNVKPYLKEQTRSVGTFP